MKDNWMEKTTPRPWRVWTNGFDSYLASADVPDADNVFGPYPPPEKRTCFGGEPSEGAVDENDPDVKLVLGAVNSYDPCTHEDGCMCRLCRATSCIEDLRDDLKQTHAGAAMMSAANDGMKEENARLVSYIERIGNRIGSPGMGYAPDVDRKILIKNAEDVSLLVQKALGICRTCKGDGQGRTKHGDPLPIEDCPKCNGTGRIQE